MIIVINYESKLEINIKLSVDFIKSTNIVKHFEIV